MHLDICILIVSLTPAYPSHSCTPAHIGHTCIFHVHAAFSSSLVIRCCFFLTLRVSLLSSLLSLSQCVPCINMYRRCPSARCTCLFSHTQRSRQIDARVFLVREPTHTYLFAFCSVPSTAPLFLHSLYGLITDVLLDRASEVAVQIVARRLSSSSRTRRPTDDRRCADAITLFRRVTNSEVVHQMPAVSQITPFYGSNRT